MDVGRTRTLHVAMVLPPFGRVPPAGQGSVERLVATLARALVEDGHRVTLFATGDSRLPDVQTAFLFREPLWPPEPLAEWNHAVFAATTLAGREVDVVHSFCPAFVALAGTTGTAVVHTITHPPDPAATRLYATHPDVRFVCLSSHQAATQAGSLARAPKVVAPGLDPRAYPPGQGGEGALFVGRLDEAHAPHRAVFVARRAGLTLSLAGGDARGDYFARTLTPQLAAGGTSLLGEVSGQARTDALGAAGVLLSPADEIAPWDLAAVEAMLCGTPVVGLRHTVLQELVDDGVTGRLADSTDALPALAREALGLDREAVRARAIERFGAGTMTRGYVEAYEEALLERAPRPVAPDAG